VDQFLEEKKEKEIMMLEHQEALKDAERRVQEAEQLAYSKVGHSGVVGIAKAVTIQSSTFKSNDVNQHQGQIFSGPKRRLRRQKKRTLLEIPEHEA
jgi:hypothetical protein